MQVTMDEKSPSYLTVKNLIAWIKAGHFNTGETVQQGHLWPVCLKMWMTFKA